MTALASEAVRNIRDTLTIALSHTSEATALVVADDASPLARLLLEAYRECLPHARVLFFNPTSTETLKAALAELRAPDLAVLIQSSVFRIPEFRTRVELFRYGVKVIEHSNLERMADSEIPHYVAALAYDPAYYRGIGHALKARMDAASSVCIESEGEQLHFSGLESAKLNIGHFDGLKNAGSLFPIGEVFSEARDLESVHGRVRIYAFTDTTFRLNVPPLPITLLVERGRVIGTHDSTADFEHVLSAIRADEGEVWLRELGFGMNRAFSRERLSVTLARSSERAAFTSLWVLATAFTKSHTSTGARRVTTSIHLRSPAAYYWMTTWYLAKVAGKFRRWPRPWRPDSQALSRSFVGTRYCAVASLRNQQSCACPLTGWARRRRLWRRKWRLAIARRSWISDRARVGRSERGKRQDTPQNDEKQASTGRIGRLHRAHLGLRQQPLRRI